MNFPIATACFAVLLAAAGSPCGFAAAPDSGHPPRVSVAEDQPQASLDSVRIASTLSRTFRVPVHHERVAVQATGRPVRTEGRVLSLRAGDALPTALERLAQLNPEHLSVRKFNNSVVITDTTPGITGENLLDRHVSVALDGASYWEAIRAIAAAATRERGGDRTLYVEPPLLGAGYAPPEVFLKPGAVTAAFDEITAREALCAVLERVPSVIRYTYFHFDFPPPSPRGRSAYMYLFMDSATIPEPESTEPRGHRPPMLGFEELEVWHQQTVFKP